MSKLIIVHCNRPRELVQFIGCMMVVLSAIAVVRVISDIASIKTLFGDPFGSWRVLATAGFLYGFGLVARPRV